ncbi:hypothetical protein LCGC14_2197270, partial [marine sediment metagenome]
MTKKLRIRNWDKWQSYRRDRGQPPWIKVHRSLMRDMNWVSLSDAQRGQLVAIWMLAADQDGVGGGGLGLFYGQGFGHASILPNGAASEGRMFHR